MISPPQVLVRGKKLLAALELVVARRQLSQRARLEYQWEELRALVEYANERIPLYRRHFASAGFSPSMLGGWKDLASIPILDKEALRGQPETDIVDAPSAGNYRLLSSSGSTGVPSRMARSEDSLWNYAAWNTSLFFDWCDGSPLSDGLYLVDLDPAGIDAAAADMLRTTVPETRLLSAHMPAPRLAERLASISPEFISAYPSTLRAVALEMRPRPVEETKLIHTTSEVLDAPARRLFGKVFPNARLVETYTSTEGGLVAFKCVEEGRWHIVETNVVAEIVDPEGNPTSGTGNLVITDLTNKATPMIRYRGLGDLAQWNPTPCPCGSTLRCIRHFEGRSSTVLLGASGCLLSPFSVTNVLEEVGGLVQYQIVQRQPGKIAVRVVASEDAVPRVLEEGINSLFREGLGGELEPEVEFVGSIEPPAGSHKIPPVISEVVARR